MSKMKLIVFCVSLCIGGVFCGLAKESDQDAVHYKFEYGVHDPQTKDIKSHWEHRAGHIVKGEYMLKEPDGTVRVVQYTADPHAGFQATVKKDGHAQHPTDYGHQDYGHSESAGPNHFGLSRFGDRH